MTTHGLRNVIAGIRSSSAIVLLIAGLLLGVSLVTGCGRYSGANSTTTFMDTGVTTTSTTLALPEAVPGDFGFVARWGVGAKNAIDTHAGTVTKDRISEPSVTAELELPRGLDVGAAVLERRGSHRGSCSGGTSRVVSQAAGDR